MTHILPQVGHQHHARILGTVDQFPDLADRLLVDHGKAAIGDLRTTREFLLGTLLPHLAAAENTIYPELERMFQNRHSMAPMRREHDDVRRFVSDFSTLVVLTDGDAVPLDRALALRRVLFRLYAVLKIHLVEEEEYLRIVEHGVSEEAAAVLAAALEHRVQ